MRKQPKGPALEAEIAKFLRSQWRCDVFVSQELDQIRKVDGEIRAVEGQLLERPVQYQLTIRTDHYTKMRLYLKRRPISIELISLYIEVEPDAQPRAVADDIAWAARQLQELPPYAGRVLPIFGLRIGEDSCFFDPFERLDELRQQRESPEYLANLKRGVIQDITPDEFVIVGEDGGYYSAHSIDADDSAFRHELRMHPQQRDLDLPVLFQPHGRFVRDLRPRPGVDPAKKT